MNYRGYLLIIVVLLSTICAQDSSFSHAQSTTDGDIVAIPLGENLITLDGSLSDWDDLQHYPVNYGLFGSSVAGENDYFEFSVAADYEYFYLAMTTSDHVLVAGEHGGDFWNEDSFEFYLNLTDDLSATDYDFGIFQIVLSPQTIGNSDPEDIIVTGLWSDTAEVQAYIFGTDGGWGCEVAVAWEPFGYQPVDEAELGLNVVLNGATQLHGSRDSKLVWSRRDRTDASWFDPSVFGTGVFSLVDAP